VAHRKSIIREALERLDRLMAIGQSRRDAKRAIREAAGERLWTISTGKMHAHTTRRVYQQHVLAFINWARDAHTIGRLARLDERADELATAYLKLRLGEGKSAYTLQAERSALRLFFGNRSLAAGVTLPRRSRTAITRSRGPVADDRHFQPAHWQPLLRFLQATGLRRRELDRLRVRDLVERDPDEQDRPTVKVTNGKGGQAAHRAGAGRTRRRRPQREKWLRGRRARLSAPPRAPRRAGLPPPVRAGALPRARARPGAAPAGWSLEAR
jgi:integrase family protein with SAM-like domain